MLLIPSSSGVIPLVKKTEVHSLAFNFEPLLVACLILLMSSLLEEVVDSLESKNRVM